MAGIRSIIRITFRRNFSAADREDRPTVLDSPVLTGATLGHIKRKDQSDATVPSVVAVVAQMMDCSFGPIRSLSISCTVRRPHTPTHWEAAVWPAK